MGQVQSAIFASAINQLFWGHSCAVSLETKKKRENSPIGLLVIVFVAVHLVVVAAG